MAVLDKEALREMNSYQEVQRQTNRFITVDMMECLTGLPSGTIYDWRKKGKLRSTTIDDNTRRVFVDLDHFNAILDSRLGEEAEYERSLEDE